MVGSNRKARGRVRARLIPMFLTALGLALALLVIVQIIQTVRGPAETTPPVGSSNPALSDDQDKTVHPVIFKAISEQNGRLRLSGSSEPDAVVSVYNGAESLGQTKADGDGGWSTVIAVSEDDELFLELIVYVENGARVRSDESLLRVPSPSGEDIDVVRDPALLMVMAPGGPSRIIQSPFRGLPTVGPLSMGPIDYDNRGSVILSGVSEVSGVVRVYANDVYVGEAFTAPDGRWFMIAAETLPTGAYDIRAELISTEGLEAEVTVPFERLSDFTGRETSEGPVRVSFETGRWQIARELYGGGRQSTVIFAPSIIQADAPDGEEPAE